ncbi:MAG: hypothetical protein KBT29_10710 [Prevotellaceae bacterium]|nr:hypothetical protein [Candidatus Minthosoma caballi]
MKKLLLTLSLVFAASAGFAQRTVDKLDRGLVAQKTTSGVFLSWRINGEEYYDVKYNVYRDGVKITDEPLDVSNYRDASGSTSNKYTVAAVVRGKEQAQCQEVTPWSSGYKEIKLDHEGIASTLIPNDACCADVDGDGEVEILMKFDNESEMAQSMPKDGPTINGKVTGEYSIFEIFKQNGKRLWWVNCGPNMGDFQNNEQNIVGYDWNGDGKAEVIMRLEEGSSIHMADGTTYTIGANGKNGGAWTNYRAATGGGTNWFMCVGKEFLVYCDGETGKVLDIIDYPLARLEAGESYESAWGKNDGGHRASKFFFGAPYLDGKHPSIFLARGIYTQIKMCAYDVNPATNKLVKRWDWRQTNGGFWMWQGYHNFGVADVDWDGRDEIVYGSMVIDDNGKGLSTTGLGHGDAQHCGDFNPYIHGQEIYACNEDQPGNNYRDATTSKIYHRYESGNDDGRAMAGNFCNLYPGGQACSAREGLISLVYNNAIPEMNAVGVNTNFRIYWDGDLLEETFNYRNGKNTEGVVAKYGSWDPIYICEGSMTNNDTKGAPCYQGDILGDWREEIIMRTANNNIRIYSTPTSTKWRNYTLWHDHQYRNAKVWQMCGYNQPPHASYYLGELEKITVAPPPLTMTDRTEVADGGTIGSALNDKHVIVCETKNSTVNIENGAKPYILTFNVPSWVQGTAGTNYTAKDAKINYEYYTCNVTGGAIAGEARIIKQGDGILNLPKADFTHTGETNIWAGTLNFDGKMKSSDLWLNRFAELNSNGGEFKNITADYGSVIRPGGENAKGTITVDNTLRLGFGSRVVLDLDGASLGGDCIKANTISIEKKTGTAWTKYGPEYIQPVIEIKGTDLVAGDYVIAEAETLEGAVTNLKIEGISTFKTGLKHENGKIILSLGSTRGASEICWMGSVNSIWDFANTENFVLAGDESATPDIFVKGDQVEFNDNAKVFTVNINEPLTVDAISVTNSKAYTFQGTGAITEGSLTKDGTGTLTIKNLHSYTGGNFLKGGVVSVSALSNDVDATGNLGAVVTNSAKFTMENGAVLQATAAVKNGSPIKFIGDEGGVINNSADFVQQKSFNGTLLTKKGSGWLKTSATGANLNRMIIAGGTVQNGNGIAAKVVELQGGSLVDNVGTNNEINIPAKKKGTWTTGNRCTYSNKLTGEGEVTVLCATEKGSNYYATRTPLQFNLSAFEGTLTAGATYTADGRFTLDTSNGSDKWTLNIPAGIIAQNSGKTLKVGAVTGKGNLGGFCTFSNNGASGTNTWTVGNASDFKFEGKVIGADKFTKVGTGKMTVTGAWETSGAVSVNAGKIHLNSGAKLGTGSLTIAKGAALTGVTKSGTPLTNSAFTINGELQVGISSSAASGEMDFNGQNVTFGADSRLVLGLRIASTDESKASGASIKNINKLTLNGTISIFLSDSYVPQQGDELRLWTGVKSFAGTPMFELPETLISKDETEIYNITWDTSDIANGIIKVASVSITDGVENIIAADEEVKVEAVSTNGSLVCTYYCPMSEAESTFRKSVSATKGIYILNITGKKTKTSKKVLK